jgi:DNA-binding NarL/FixJ family response regulator
MASWHSLRSAAAALDLAEPAWIAVLFAEARELLDDGDGLFVYAYSVDARGAIVLTSLSGEHTATNVWNTLFDWGAKYASSLAPRYATGAGALGLAAAPRRLDLRELAERLEAHGIGELFTLVAHEKPGSGVFLTAPRTQRVRLAREERRALEHLAVELAATVRFREARRASELVRLTASELAVARLLQAGASDKEIAESLAVGLSTVSTFAQRLRRKLACGNGGEALALACGGALERERRLALFARLSASECDVAAELVSGSSYAEIARRRRTSERTVAAQCASIFRKCSVSGRRALAAAMFGGAGAVGAASGK